MRSIGFFHELFSKNWKLCSGIKLSTIPRLRRTWFSFKIKVIIIKLQQYILLKFSSLLKSGIPEDSKV